MDRPAVVIELAIEDTRPRVFIYAMTDGQEARVVDWVKSQDELSELVARALELAERAEAA